MPRMGMPQKRPRLPHGDAQKVAMGSVSGTPQTLSLGQSRIP